MSTTTKSGWRADLPVHPAAEMFPPMSKAELRGLADDIKKNGLESLPVILQEKTGNILLDGRNRLDALELIGGDTTQCQMIIAALNRSFDPVAYIISKNIHRRHLNVEQRQELLIALIAQQPEQSNRQIAKTIGVDHKTIGAARIKGEDVGRICHVTKRTDSKGRKQLARRPKPKSEPVGRPPVRSSEVPATSVPPDSPDNTAKTSAHNLAELTFALRTYAPRITVAADREKARALALELLGDVKASDKPNGRDHETADLLERGS